MTLKFPFQIIHDCVLALDQNSSTDNPDVVQAFVDLVRMNQKRGIHDKVIVVVVAIIVVVVIPFFVAVIGTLSTLKSTVFFVQKSQKIGRWPDELINQ